MIASTDRLYLRVLTTEDAIHFYAINSDPDCIMFTGDEPFKSVTEAKKFLLIYKRRYETYKMGRWAVCLKETDEFLGWCGLKYHPEEQLVDLGYRFYKKFWNKGYATEAAKAAIAYGFKQLDLDRIVAHVHVDNGNSHHVVLKADLNYIKDFSYDGQPAKFYELKKNDYLRKD